MKRNALSIPVKADSIAGFLAFLTLAFSVFVGIYWPQPPQPVPADAPLTEFSSGRAIKHLDAVALRPHPVGSPENAVVRNYILKELTDLGLETQVQETTALNQIQFMDSSIAAGTVRNVVARLKGSDSIKAVLLMGHYDSVPTGPGASDDGAAVAALLETARALKASPPLKNDVIFLFTEGEETGLLGAAAFVDEHPWAKDVGLVVNLEARGNSGPSILFETSSENRWLVQEFAKAVPYPVAYSVASDVYRFLPNKTDFTVFREAGFSGLNFSFIKGTAYYHTARDSIDNLDESSLQHHGSYALALARHFGNLPQDRKGGDEIYFTLLGSIFVHYPETWCIPLMVLAVLAAAGVVTFGFRSRRLAFPKMGWGFLAVPSGLVAPLLVQLVWQVIRVSHKGYANLRTGDTFNSDLYMAGFAALTAAVVSLLYAWLCKKIGTENLAIGGLLWWLILAVVTTLAMPGSSYLFVWPLLLSLAGLGILFAWQDRASDPVKRWAILAICAVPEIILLVPTIHLLFIALTLTMSGIVMVTVVLLMSLLIPYLDLMSAHNKWWLPAALALVSLGFIVAASLSSGFDADHPQTNSIYYGLDADSNRAVWASGDAKLDEWTSQFMSADAKLDAIPAFFPFVHWRDLISPAPSSPLPAPLAVLLDDSTDNGIRTLKMRLASARQASSIRAYVTSNSQVVGFAVNGKQLGPGGRPAQTASEKWGIWYWALPQDGIELTLQVKPPRPIEIRVVDQSFGLPEIPGKSYEPRPDYMQAAPFPWNSDVTMVSKTYTY